MAITDEDLLKRHTFLSNLMATHYTKSGMAELKTLHAEIVKRGLTV